MPRRACRPLTLIAGALALPLCLARPGLAEPLPDPIDAEIIVPASAGAAVNVALFEAALPRDIAAPAENDAAAASEGMPPTSVLEFATGDFDVELFEAALPRDAAAPAENDAAVASEGKPPPISAAVLPPKRMLAARQPPERTRARGKASNPAPASRPAAGKLAAAPPATNPHARPRAARAERGPRELFIARLPPSDRDEVMPAVRPIPVIRASLPPPAVALK